MKKYDVSELDVVEIIDKPNGTTKPNGSGKKNAKPSGQTKPNGGRKTKKNVKPSGQTGSAKKSKLPTIKIVNGKLTTALTEIDAAIRARGGQNIYQRSGRVVYAKTVKLPTWEKGVATNVQHLVGMSKDNLIVLLEDVCELLKYNIKQKKWLCVNCPDRLADMYLNNARNLPAIAGIINAPTILSDGSIIEKPGYDYGGEMLFDSKGVTFPRSRRSQARTQPTPRSRCCRRRSRIFRSKGKRGRDAIQCRARLRSRR